MKFSIKNFRDWTTTIIGVGFLIGGLVMGFMKEWWICFILSLIGISLMGLPTPDWAHEIIDGIIGKKPEPPAPPAA